MSLYQKIERMWWQSAPPPLLLQWASRVYEWANQRNLQRRAARFQTPPLPLVSIGNITVGGSGKTPFVIWLARALQGKGIKPVVLCRGDGGSQPEPKIITESDSAELVGDEARLLFESCGCPVIAGRDRIRASQMAAGLGDVILLDDGFQYRQLARICDIVLVPAAGIGNGHQLPAGPLREFPNALDRADIIIRTGKETPVQIHASREWCWHTQPGELVQVAGQKAPVPKKVVAACAIARPQRFFQSLQEKGLELGDKVIFRDHHRFSAHDMSRLTKTGLPVVVTGKDAVKLRSLWPASVPLWVQEQKPIASQDLLEAIVRPILSAR